MAHDVILMKNHASSTRIEAEERMIGEEPPLSQTCSFNMMDYYWSLVLEINVFAVERYSIVNCGNRCRGFVICRICFSFLNFVRMHSSYWTWLYL